MDQQNLEHHNPECTGQESFSPESQRAQMRVPSGEAPAVEGYSVCRRLGHGGNAEVWLVSQDSTGVKLALKCFGRPAGSEGSSTLEAGGGTAREEDVRRELLVMSVLDHEHLVKAYGLVRTGEPQEGSFGLLMDYAAGGSLQQLVTARGRLGVGETVTVLTPIAQVLGYLHGKGFTHSDVAPGNVLFTAHGKPLLADLGVARMVGDASGVPDQRTDGFADPAPVDAVRAGLQPGRDVYAAAALGWYCLTGQPPPPSAARPPLSLLVPEVPAELAAALEAGLSDDRRQRPAAGEFARAVYCSAAAVPVDLSRSVHDTVLPELLTRRPLPPPGGRLRNCLHSWARRLKTTGWVRAVIRLSPRGETAVPLPPLPRAVARESGSGSARLNQGVGHATGRRDAVSRAARHTAARHTAGRETATRLAAGRHIAVGHSSATRSSVRHSSDRRSSVRDSAEKRTTDSTASVASPARVRRTVGANGRRSRRLAMAGGACTAAVLSGAALLGLPGVGLPGAAQQSGPVAQNPGPETGQPAATGQGVPPAGGPGSPQGALQQQAGVPDDVRRQLAAKDPVEAVRGLAELRSLALRDGRLNLLDDVNAPNTPAHAADRAIRTRLERSGTVVAGFRTSLTGLRRLPESTPTRAVVAATSSATGYEEQGVDGGVVATGAPQQAVRLRLVLVQVEGRWRIADILAD